MPKKLLLNRNEIVEGPSPEVIRALRAFDRKKVSFYFDGYHGSRLIPELARRFRLPENQILAGYGIEFFIRTIFDSLRSKRARVLMHTPRFTYYSHYARLKGIRVVDFKMFDNGKSFSFDVPDCIKKIKAAKPGAIIISSPNNPTGTSLTPADLAKILKAASKSTLVVLDEAYHGFDPGYDEKKMLALVKKHPNLLVLRSFSKRYALAGMRIAFGIAGRNVKKMLRFEHFYLGGSRLLEDIALAALRSEKYYAGLSKKIIAARGALIEQVNRLAHFKAYPSNANFFFVKTAASLIKKAEKELKKFPFAVSKFVAPDGMRVSIGHPRHMRTFINVLKKVDR